MEGRRLDSFDADLPDAGKLLKKFEDDPSKIECLQIFVNCIKMVKWIQETSKGALIRLCM